MRTLSLALAALLIFPSCATKPNPLHPNARRKSDAEVFADYFREIERLQLIEQQKANHEQASDRN